MRAYELKLDGKLIRVFAEKRKGHLWFHYKGQTFAVDMRPKSTKQKTGASGGNVILAPMPGKILKVNVKVGDIVKAKQTLVVMEAMKMEYALTAPSDGKVETIKCRVGDQVSLGAVMVELAVEKKA